jgi:molybdate transport system substrate-binding protein
MMGRFFSRRATLAAVIECSFLLALGAAAPAAHAAEVKVMSTVALTPTHPLVFGRKQHQEVAGSLL